MEPGGAGEVGGRIGKVTPRGEIGDVEPGGGMDGGISNVGRGIWEPRGEIGDVEPGGAGGVRTSLTGGD